MKPNYQSEEWADVVPIPQDDGGPNPLAAIAYTDEYSEASDYLRALMAADEKSQRALQLTEHIISMNAAHYTVWVYRAAILKALMIRPEQELIFLTSISLRHIKNYQIWHHRQVIMSQLQTMPETEPEFLALVLSKDAKNYHVWSYRQWLVSHFQLWADQSESEPATNGELAYVEKLLDDDVRNNSAWHHRYFVVFGRSGTDAPAQAVVDRELDFAKGRIAIAPQNQSGWNYLQGVVRKAQLPTDHITAFAAEYADIDEPEAIRSVHALDILATAWANLGDQEKDKASKALDLLADSFDPIRKRYWLWRKGQLQANNSSARSGAGAAATPTAAATAAAG